MKPFDRGRESHSHMEEPLDSRQLKAFVILAKSGSYTETANQLYVTHSAISHAMRALESSVGCRLLSNMNKKVMLTEAGEALLQHAQQVLEEMKRARMTLTALNKWGSRRLRIMAEAPLGWHFLTGVLVEFHRKHPRVQVSVELLNYCDAPALLGAGRTDIVFCERPPLDDRFEFIGLFTDNFHIVVSPTHRWAVNGAVTASELATAPFILHRSLGESQRMVREYLANRNVILNAVAEMDGLDAIKDFVRQSEALTILPTWAVRRELREGTLVALPLGSKRVEQTWGFAHWRHRPLSHAEASLLELCRRAIAAITKTAGIRPMGVEVNTINVLRA